MPVNYKFISVCAPKPFEHFERAKVPSFALCAAGGIKLRFHCVDGAGHTFVEATIDAHYETGGTIQNVVLAMPVEAAAVDEFVRELQRLDLDRSGTATLKGPQAS
jgi:hypothetical protein